MNFSLYDGKRLAIVFSVQGQTRMVRGRAQYDHDAILGNILRIAVEDEEGFGQPEIVLAEDSWSGTVQPDTQHGCDFVFTLF